jgi:hypothetical protein
MCGQPALTAIAALGCSSPTKPNPALPTLVVMNATCDVQDPRNPSVCLGIPLTAVCGRPRSRRQGHGATTCLTFPASWTLHVETAGSNDTTLYKGPPDSAGIYLFAVDSALFYLGGTLAQRDSSNHALWPYDGVAPGSVGHAPTFIPGSAIGWSVTVPDTSPTGLAAPGLTATAACRECSVDCPRDSGRADHRRASVRRS